MDVLLVLLITLFALPLSMILTVCLISFIIKRYVKKKLKHEAKKNTFDIDGFAERFHELLSKSRNY